MDVKWISYFFFFVAALVHVYFFILESILFQRPGGYKYFKMKPEDHGAVKQWAFNQGLYNLFLAIAMFMGLNYVNQLEVKTAGAMVSFAGLSMIAAGIALWFTNKKLRLGALVQMIPPLLGFFFLMFHVVDRIRSIQ